MPPGRTFPTIAHRQPGTAGLIVLPDDTGITVIGTREDNDLVVRLVEQYDVPELQVLIEIFIITVSRDFSRQIDSLSRPPLQPVATTTRNSCSAACQHGNTGRRYDFARFRLAE